MIGALSGCFTAVYDSGKTQASRIKCGACFYGSQLFFAEKFNSIKDNYLPDFAKKFYDKQIAPLEKLPYIVFGTSITTAVILSAIALSTLGLAVLPAVVWVDVLLILGSSVITSYQLKSYYDKRAVEKLKILHQCVKNASNQDWDLAIIQRNLFPLQYESEYGHRKDLWNKLSEHLKDFERNVLINGNNCYFEANQKFYLLKLKAEKKLYAKLKDDFETLVKLEERLKPQKNLINNEELNSVLTEILESNRFIQSTKKLANEILRNFLKFPSLNESKEALLTEIKISIQLLGGKLDVDQKDLNSKDKKENIIDVIEKPNNSIIISDNPDDL